MCGFIVEEVNFVKVEYKLNFSLYGVKVIEMKKKGLLEMYVWVECNCLVMMVERCYEEFDFLVYNKM